MGELLDKAKGKFKKVTGAISGHRTTELEGVAYEQKGNLEGAANRVREDMKEAKDRMSREMPTEGERPPVER